MAYYYTRDHLGSVREMLNSSGTIVARYAYDPYGRTTLVSGSNMATFQYAQMYFHQPSGLALTRYRAYDMSVGHWLSRDPLAENLGANLYMYGANDPIDLEDSLGLCVEGTYARATHTLTLTDSDTKATVTVNNMFSGNGPTADDPAAEGYSRENGAASDGPLPGGDYKIGTQNPQGLH